MHAPRAAERATPYWWEAAPLRSLPQQALPKKLDVLIVGAGYAGSFGRAGAGARGTLGCGL